MTRITFIADGYCVRAQKMHEVLQGIGYEIPVITSQPQPVPWGPPQIYYNTIAQLRAAIRNHAKTTDIWHVHNEPNYAATLIREMYPKAKIILDMHDSNYWRIPKTYELWGKELIHWPEEDMGVLSADAFVVPSDECGIELHERTAKQTIVVWSAAPGREYQPMTTATRAGLVMFGGHSAPGKFIGEKQDGYNQLDSWRDYTAIYTAFSKHRHVSAFCQYFKPGTMDPLTNYYSNLSITCGVMPRPELLAHLGEFTWNLVGNMKSEKDDNTVWKYALPNKFHDAIAGGVPSLIWGKETPAGRIAEKYKIGIAVDSIEEALDRWSEHREKRFNLHMKRSKFTMEKQIDPLIKLYDSL